MNRFLVISPHLDDAVLGAGAYLAGEPGIVLTVFDGVPRAGMVTDYDASCGFEASDLAMATRRAENAAALEELACFGLGVGKLDRQYRVVQMRTGEVTAAIGQVFRNSGAEALLAPLGIQHPDHVLASDACLRLAGEGIATWIYEELPYRVVWPEAAEARKAFLRSRGWELVPDHPGDGDAAAKERAIKRYASQTFDLHCCLVPERFWVVRRP